MLGARKLLSYLRRRAVHELEEPKSARLSCTDDGWLPAESSPDGIWRSLLGGPDPAHRGDVRRLRADELPAVDRASDSFHGPERAA